RRAVDPSAPPGGSGDPHQRRDAGEQLPPLAVGLRGVHLRRYPLARVPRPAAPGRGPRIPAPGATVRAYLGATSQVNDRNRNLLARIATAVVLLPLVVLLLGLGGWWCAVLVAFAAGVCALEYERITVRELGPGQILAVVGAAAIPLAAAWNPDRFAGVGF